MGVLGGDEGAYFIRANHGGLKRSVDTDISGVSQEVYHMIETALLCFGVYQALAPVADKVSNARTKQIVRGRENERQARIGRSVQRAVKRIGTARPKKAPEVLVPADWIPVFGGDTVLLTGDEALRLQDVGDEEWDSDEVVQILRHVLEQQPHRARAAQAA